MEDYMEDNGYHPEPEDLEETDAISMDDLYTVLDDEVREDLDEMLGQTVVDVNLWEESIGDEEGELPAAEDRTYVDCDILFENGLVSELFIASVYPDPDGDPLKGLEPIAERLNGLIEQSLQLMEYDQADEEGGLALAFGDGDKVKLVIAANAWLISEWEEEEEEE
jgi:hypothetical protein